MRSLKIILFIDSIRQKFSRIKNIIIPRNINSKINNYPYLGVDTYFNLCSVQISNKNEFFKLNILEYEEITSLFLNGDVVSEFITHVSSSKLFIRLDYIIISESDKSQSVGELIELLKISNKIFSSNLQGTHKQIFPLPLGLEKQSFRNGSQMKDFKKFFKISVDARPINFIIAWNDQTNPNRKIHRLHFQDVEKSIVIKKRINAVTLHKIMGKSKFVPSPAGNGFDCHRTWEAIYLGCVPVVLKSEYVGDLEWPILVIEKWDDLTSKSQEELNKIYTKYSLDQKQSLDFSIKILSSFEKS